MSDDRVGVVRATNEAAIDRPSVQVLAPENAGEVVDLAQKTGVRIVESLNPHAEGGRYLPLIGCPAPLSDGDEADGEGPEIDL